MFKRTSCVQHLSKNTESDVSWGANHHIRMIAEESCDTDFLSQNTKYVYNFVVFIITANTVCCTMIYKNDQFSSCFVSFTEPRGSG